MWSFYDSDDKKYVYGSCSQAVFDQQNLRQLLCFYSIVLDYK